MFALKSYNANYVDAVEIETLSKSNPKTPVKSNQQTVTRVTSIKTVDSISNELARSTASTATVVTKSTSTPSSTYSEALVMQCLADNVSLTSKYKITLYDFGGQSVFNVIHPFFLTQYGVYIVAFNMEWLLGNEGN